MGMAENVSNENIKHTEGGEMPDASTSGQLISRARADLPALRTFLGSKSFLIPVIFGSAVGFGVFFYNHYRKIGPFDRMKSVFGL